MGILDRIGWNSKFPAVKYAVRGGLTVGLILSGVGAGVTAFLSVKAVGLLVAAIAGPCVLTCCVSGCIGKSKGNNAVESDYNAMSDGEDDLGSDTPPPYPDIFRTETSVASAASQRLPIPGTGDATASRRSTLGGAGSDQQRHMPSKAYSSGSAELSTSATATRGLVATGSNGSAGGAHYPAPVLIVGSGGPQQPTRTIDPATSNGSGAKSNGTPRAASSYAPPPRIPAAGTPASTDAGSVTVAISPSP